MIARLKRYVAIVHYNMVEEIPTDSRSIYDKCSLAEYVDQSRVAFGRTLAAYMYMWR